MSAVDNFRFNLSSVLKEQNVSQRAVAEGAGLSYVYVNRVLQGKTSPSLECCEKIANAIHLPLEDLISHPADFSAKMSA